MRLLGFEISRKRKSVIGAAPTLAPPSGSIRGGWFPVIREMFAGAFQRDINCRPETVMAFSPVFACITRIAADIGKLRFILKSLDMKASDGIYTEVMGPSPFWPVLRKPNHYQSHIDFKESWLISKLRTGNTFILKVRDNRGMVTALYVLDPLRVQPLVATDGSIFYRLASDIISGLDQASVTVPASEIIHDRMNCLFHPLIGVSPLFACALSAAVGLEIEKNSGRFFINGAKISGVIMAPGQIDDVEAKELEKRFKEGYTGENAGKVAVLGDGLKFQPLTMSSNDAQLVEQLKMSAQMVCTAFHMPPHKIGVGPLPNYDNTEAVNQQYYSECLQSPIEKMEEALADGLSIPQNFSVELDIDSLLRMDKKTQMLTMSEGIKASILAPNEGRKKLDLKPVPGGDSPLSQQQNFSLEALAKRDALPNPFVIDKPVSNPTPDSGGKGDPTGSAVEEDPAVAAGGKSMLEAIEGEFRIVVSHIAPLALPAPKQEVA